MISAFYVRFGALVAVVVGTFVVYASLQRPFSTDAVQRGFRGTGMDLIYHRDNLRAVATANQLPDAIPPTDPVGQKASEVYQNVQVLKDVDVGEFGRLMASLTAWVAPEQGCAYCHAEGQEFSSDSLYTKRVARRMLQMTQHINADWKSHVAETGVTCYTCHRGQPVPAYIWFKNSGTESAEGPAGGHTGKNQVSVAAAYASLPVDPFTPFLEDKDNIRVASTQALPGSDRSSIKQTEWTYALMMHFSTALGVNCTYCHNTRIFASWEQSSPARVTAWYGIRMVRDLNDGYLKSLAGVFPANRLGPSGDVPKVNCLTCHQGAFKPLLGASMVKDYPELQSVPVAAATPATAPAAAPAPKPAPAAPPPAAAPVSPPAAAAPPSPAAASPAPAPVTPPAAAAPAPATPPATAAPAPVSPPAAESPPVAAPPAPAAVTPPAPPPAAAVPPPATPAPAPEAPK